MSYCPVYDCNSDAKKNSIGIHFFAFPGGKSASQRIRRKAWIEFCKRKTFKPLSNSRICSLHFAEDAYEPGHSPQFLERLDCKETFRVQLKSDALPTLNKPLLDTSGNNARPFTERRQRDKEVSELLNPRELPAEEECSTEQEETVPDELLGDQPTDEEPSTSATFETELFFRNFRERSTQTNTKHATRSVKTQTVMTAATSTFFQSKVSDEVYTDITVDNAEGISHASVCVATVSTQDATTTEVDVESITSEESGKQQSEFVPMEESSTESDESSSDHEDPDIRKILKEGKPPQEQIKFIVFEDAIMDVFGKCGQCGSKCIVTMENQIGSSCKICSSCTTENEHYFEWTTGPSMSKMPAFHLLLASGILATGMESSKVLRLFNALNIPNLKQRELSNILKNYVIPSVYKIWQEEQSTRLQELKGEPVVIASDMRVDSPGHTGLFGSGSTLEMGHNLILDTKIIKVN